MWHEGGKSFPGRGKSRCKGTEVGDGRANGTNGRCFDMAVWDVMGDDTSKASWSHKGLILLILVLGFFQKTARGRHRSPNRAVTWWYEFV